MSQQQQDEIKTIKKREITLELSDADVQRICEKAGAVGLTVADLLQNFIGDLITGTYSNGSDERMYAEQWFERCWFGMFPDKTFLRWLIAFGYVEGMIADWNELQEMKEDLKLDESEFDEDDLEYMKSLENGINSIWLSYKEDGGEDASLEEGIRKVLEWHEQKETLKQGVDHEDTEILECK